MLTVQLMQTQGTGFVLDLYPEIIVIYSHSQPHLLETPLFVLKMLWYLRDRCKISQCRRILRKQVFLANTDTLVQNFRCIVYVPPEKYLLPMNQVYWLVNVDELVATLGLGSNPQGALLWQMSKLVL